MLALLAGIHAACVASAEKTWTAETSPDMTRDKMVRLDLNALTAGAEDTLVHIPF